MEHQHNVGYAVS